LLGGRWAKRRNLIHISTSYNLFSFNNFSFYKAVEMKIKSDEIFFFREKEKKLFFFPNRRFFNFLFFLFLLFLLGGSKLLLFNDFSLLT